MSDQSKSGNKARMAHHLIGQYQARVEADEQSRMKVRHYTITLNDGTQATFGHCAKEPLSEDFICAMKAVMEAAADDVRNGRLQDEPEEKQTP